MCEGSIVGMIVKNAVKINVNDRLSYKVENRENEMVLWINTVVKSDH